MDSDEKNKFDSLEKRVYNVEKYHEYFEERITDIEQKSNDQDNSIISFVLDILNVKRLLELIFYNQKRIKITNNFINLTLLTLFLVIVFWKTGTISFERSPTTEALFLICIVGLIELVGANTSIFKAAFSRDAKTRIFLEKVHSMSSNEIKEAIKYQFFSVRCMDYFIKSLENKDKYSPEVVDLIIGGQVLRTQNLDLLFGKNVIVNLHADLIIGVLFEKRDSLKTQNIQNIYESCKDNRKIIKILIATQKYSDSLLKQYPKNTELFDFYEKYQNEKTHLDWILKIVPISHIKKIHRTLIFVTFTVPIVLYAVVGPINYEHSGVSIQINDIFAILVVSFIFVAMLNSIFILPFLNWTDDKYYNRYIGNVTNN